jgi:hypothetical protein
MILLRRTERAPGCNGEYGAASRAPCAGWTMVQGQGVRIASLTAIDQMKAIKDRL